MATLKDPLPRNESELGRNRKMHGDKSYYYAHNEGWEVPEDAVVRDGPGLITGGAPVKLGPDGQPIEVSPQKSVKVDEDGNPIDNDVSSAVIQELRRRVDELEKELMQQRAGVKALTQFSFSDEGPKCKVYVEVGNDFMERKETLEDGGVAHCEAAVSVSFTKRRAVLRVLVPKSDGTVTEKRAVKFVCQSDVVPEKCTYKVDRSKGKVTITFKKEDEVKKWHNITTEAQ